MRNTCVNFSPRWVKASGFRDGLKSHNGLNATFFDEHDNDYTWSTEHTFILRDGYSHNWHFDESQWSTTVLLQEAEEGGDFFTLDHSETNSTRRQLKTWLPGLSKNVRQKWRIHLNSSPEPWTYSKADVAFTASLSAREAKTGCWASYTTRAQREWGTRLVYRSSSGAKKTWDRLMWSHLQFEQINWGPGLCGHT